MDTGLPPGLLRTSSSGRGRGRGRNGLTGGEGIQHPVERGRVDDADVHGCDPTLRIEQHQRRDTEQPPGLDRLTGLVDDDGQTTDLIASLLQLKVVVEADGDEPNALAPVGSLPDDDARHLIQAGRAPCAPEVERSGDKTLDETKDASPDGEFVDSFVSCYRQ